jgi:hypothetical protein
MAIPRLSMKVGKAGKAGPHAAYIAREGQYANRLERGERLEATEAGNMPAWAEAQPQAFWQAADAFERSNGTTYREMEIALPREMDAAQRIELAKEWVRQEIGDKYPYQWAIHVPTAADGGEQPHLHLMFSERRLDGIERDPEQHFKRYNAKAPEKGGARKDNTGKDAALRRKELIELRGRWEEMANQHLERAGIEARIDMRSHADRGLDYAPEAKQLPSQWRDPEQRAQVLEYRAARSEQQRAAGELRQAVPDLQGELIQLDQVRKRGERANGISEAQVAEVWKKARVNRATAIQHRANTGADKVRRQMGVIQDERKAKMEAHVSTMPKAPTTLSRMGEMFGKASYEKLKAAWDTTMAKLSNWRHGREVDLAKRLRVFQDYAAPALYQGTLSKAEQKAEKVMRREQPELGQRWDKLQEQEREARRQKAQEQALERQQKHRERGRGGLER